MLAIAFVLGYFGRLYLPFFTRPLPGNFPPLTDYLATMVLTILTVMMVFYLARLYHQSRTISRIDLVRDVLGMVTIGSVIAYGSQDFLFKNTPFEVDYPRSMFFYVTVFSAVLCVLGRELVRSLRTRLRELSVDLDNLLVVGGGSVAYDIALRIKQSKYLGYNIVGIVTKHGEQSDALPGVDVVGTYADLPIVIDQLAIEQVIIAVPDAKRVEMVELISACQRGHVDIKIYPDVLAYMAGDLNVDDLGGTPLITVRDIALRGWKLSLKRGMDFVGALFGLIFLSPVMLLIALLIRLESDGPIFYTQERMGLDGRRFEMIKFRSMRIDAENVGPGWTVPDDPRVTRIGNFLRSTNFDELPQLINVFVGQMSLVGPRPERPVYVQQFREHIPRYMERHREKAGMTGWAQVNGLRGDTSITDRTAYDLWYVENWSLWLDIKIILRTIYQTITRSSPNAY